MPPQQQVPFQTLLNHLQSLPRGAVVDMRKLEQLLAACWDNFTMGPHGHGMKADKLHKRMTNVTWEPPLLRFTVERHGGRVLGSKWIQSQSWTIDLNQRMAKWAEGKKHLDHDAESPLDVEPLADDIAQSILNRNKMDSRLKWMAQNRVKVLIGRIVPANHLAKETVKGRRRPFRRSLTER